MKERLPLAKAANLLSEKIKEEIGQFILNFNAYENKQILVGALTALAKETGRLKWMAQATEGVDPAKFNEMFLEGLEIQYNENVERYGVNDLRSLPKSHLKN